MPPADFSPLLSNVSVTSPVIFQSPGRWMSQSTNGWISAAVMIFLTSSASPPLAIPCARFFSTSLAAPCGLPPTRISPRVPRHQLAFSQIRSASLPTPTPNVPRFLTIGTVLRLRVTCQRVPSLICTVATSPCAP